ncbi:MAG: type II toxin-antitoxin system VapC family toxin [Candidatus Eisenbacteria bacterium]|uniref:Type II toxin-antitoxin system VapC family toxin n=1 Tax=Eiseniibacteriota bacterium TaxID=2212470 RepID=A0A7Y2E5C2_UNCEI|nr:type II toxin-antitoxin system VapC family toxin [Candidatus Eisenbacteria bacterium]
MILVDTSIWVDHLRKGDSGLVSLLEEGQVSCHPYLIGELACGSLKNRREILTLLRALPATVVASDNEVHEVIDQHRLYGIGIGLIDVHLLTSSLLSGEPLWTRDKALASAAKKLKASYSS